MNPKYIWLTLTAAFTTFLYGIYGAIYPPKQASAVRIAVILIFTVAIFSTNLRELGIEDMLFKPF
jgi:hypothetical protein